MGLVVMRDYSEVTLLRDATRQDPLRPRYRRPFVNSVGLPVPLQGAI